MEKRLPRSLRKFIRRQKAHLRRETANPEEERQKIEELLNRFKGR